MKKMFLLLMLSAVLFSCSKDADDTPSGLRDFGITLRVDANYQNSQFVKSWYAFLSDQDGNILDSGELQAGQSLTLYTVGDPSDVYDLSYVYNSYYDFNDEETYTINTYSNIDAGEYNICPRLAFESTNDEIYLNLTKIGYPGEVTSSTAGVGTIGPENGGYYNYRGNLTGSPTSDFYISFNNPNEQFDRYFWRKDVTEGSVFNIDYTTLPEIQNTVNVQSPSNTIFGYGVEGLINGDINNIHHSIREGNYPNGVSSLSIPVPTNVFDSFYFRVGFGNNSFQFFRVQHSAIIPASVASPNLSFIVNNQSPANFNMTTNGEGTTYDVIFRGSNANETVFVAHRIYGEVAPEIAFSKENLRMNIQQTYPDLTGFETLPLGSVSLTYYNTLSNSYKDILKNRIEGKVNIIPLNMYYEGVSKQFD